MKPENFTERKKLFIRFGIVYLGTIIVLVGRYLLSSGREPTPVPEQAYSPEQVSAG